MRGGWGRVIRGRCFNEERDGGGEEKLFKVKHRWVTELFLLCAIKRKMNLRREAGKHTNVLTDLNSAVQKSGRFLCACVRPADRLSLKNDLHWAKYSQYVTESWDAPAAAFKASVSFSSACHKHVLSVCLSSCPCISFMSGMFFRERNECTAQWWLRNGQLITN